MTQIFNLPKTRDWYCKEVMDAKEAGAIKYLFPESLARHSEVNGVRKGIVYLATPYTKLAEKSDGSDTIVQSASQAAGRAAGEWAARLANAGITVISPIAQAVMMLGFDGKAELDPLDQDFWEKWCAPILSASISVAIPPIPGWQESNGIWHEVRTALLKDMPVTLIKE